MTWYRSKLGPVRSGVPRNALTSSRAVVLELVADLLPLLEVGVRVDVERLDVVARRAVRDAQLLTDAVEDAGVGDGLVRLGLLGLRH
ncbi:hypothetical protein [Lentzea sp. NPDC059081]|uniref:hypothetical protein n=1 Tax=Lentzea sp. NPDC059081 TaxID=3346719 RepID=UPI0036A911DF